MDIPNGNCRWLRWSNCIVSCRNRCRHHELLEPGRRKYKEVVIRGVARITQRYITEASFALALRAACGSVREATRKSEWHSKRPRPKGVSRSFVSEGLTSRQGRTIGKTGQMDVITTEILSTAIHVLEHPSEGISTAHLRPFVPAISNEKPLALR